MNDRIDHEVTAIETLECVISKLETLRDGAGLDLYAIPIRNSLVVDGERVAVVLLEQGFGREYTYDSPYQGYIKPPPGRDERSCRRYRTLERM